MNTYLLRSVWHCCDQLLLWAGLLQGSQLPGDEWLLLQHCVAYVLCGSVPLCLCGHSKILPGFLACPSLRPRLDDLRRQKQTSRGGAVYCLVRPHDDLPGLIYLGHVLRELDCVQPHDHAAAEQSCRIIPPAAPALCHVAVKIAHVHKCDLHVKIACTCPPGFTCCHGFPHPDMRFSMAAAATA